MRSAPTSLIRLLAATALVATLTLVGGPPAGAATPTVTVTPATGLTDWTYVRVTGEGFEPNALLEYFQCRGGAVDENDCDGYNADYVDADGEGKVDFVVPVDARIWLPDGTEVDCRTDPAGCELGVGYMLDADEWPEAPLEFDPDAPLRPAVTATVTPATGLVDGQTVTVLAEHVLPRFETWVFQCAGGAGTGGSAMGVRWGRMCHLDNEVRGVADLETETLELEIDVHERFTTPFGDQIDCNLELDGCEIVVAWGFSDQPDRMTAVPIAFATQPPPTAPPTTPTTPPTTTRPPAPTPPAPPAPPVTGRPAYTG